MGGMLNSRWAKDDSPLHLMGLNKHVKTHNFVETF